jgi:histone H3/H4
MSVNTKGMFEKMMTPSEVASLLPKHLTNVVWDNGWKNDKYDNEETWSGFISFLDGEVMRSMHVYITSSSDDHKEFIKTGTPRTFVSLGYWGNAPEIIRHVVEGAGGWFLECDTNDDWVVLPQSRNISSEDREALETAVFTRIAREAIEKQMSAIGMNPKQAPLVIQHLLADLNEIELEAGKVNREAGPAPKM